MTRALRQLLTLGLGIVLGLGAPLRAAPSTGRPTKAIRRLAFLVSANLGGPTRVPLRYANKDADSMAAVLEDLGGILVDDTIVVKSATRATLVQGIAALREKLRSIAIGGERLEVLFYYSGHSNERGLLLGSDVYSYKELKDSITSLQADVQILVLDSCESGQLIAGKGGLRRPAFLLDSSAQARGHAIITSASSTEAAQESATISGSFFTYYFISGLRGAADANGDGKVTLSEAYQYAYGQTLARTEATRSGPQHPSYDFQLAGTGEIVLTDLRQARSSLVFAAPLAGRYFVHAQSGPLIAEIDKTSGRQVELGLEPGDYRVFREVGQQHAEADLALVAGDHMQVSGLSYKVRYMENNPTRGDAHEPSAAYGDAITSLDLFLLNSHAALAVALDELAYTHLSGKFGTRGFYGILDFAARHHIRRESHDDLLSQAGANLDFVSSIGLGTSYDLSWGYLALDFVVANTTSGFDYRLLATLSWPVAPHLAIFAGPSVNWDTDFVRDRLAWLRWLHGSRGWSPTAGATLPANYGEAASWPGAQLGVSLEL